MTLLGLQVMCLFRPKTLSFCERTYFRLSENLKGVCCEIQPLYFVSGYFCDVVNGFPWCKQLQAIATVCATMLRYERDYREQRK